MGNKYQFLTDKSNIYFLILITNTFDREKIMEVAEGRDSLYPLNVEGRYQSLPLVSSVIANK